MGFRHILSEESSKLQIVEQLEMMDDPDHAIEIAWTHWIMEKENRNDLLR